MSIPLKPDDPAYWMLERGRQEEQEKGDVRSWRSTPVVYDPECYICTDKEFELMGLPLCEKCPACVEAKRGNGHIAADDDICTACGYERPHMEPEDEA